MGTVPDPLIPARLSLVAAPEEKNGLRDSQSPKHLCKQASVETNSNGFPLTAKAQPAGDHMLDTSCATVADESKDEQHGGHDTNQPSMFSPGSFSPSEEGHLAILESASNSEQEGSKGSRIQAVAEGCTPVQPAVKGLATQEANEIVQSGDRGQFCRATDKANSTPRDGVEGSEATQGCISPCLQSTAHQASPVVKETVGEKTGPERIHLLVKESAVPDLGVQPPVCLGSEPMDRKDASPHLGAEAMPGKVLQPHLESTPEPPGKTETEEKAVSPLSKFKDTGTMTVQMDPRSAAGEVVRKDRQDAEVQAVVSVENKSASTSPTILAAFLTENMHPGTKQQEPLHVIYTGAGGKEPSDIVDGFAPLLQIAPPVGIMPEVHIQATATVDTSGTQSVRLQSDPVGMHDTVSSALSGSGKHPCSLTSCRTQDTSVSRTEAQKATAASNYGDVSQQPSDVSVLLKTRPVYQITVNSSSQSVAPLQSVNVETKLPPSAILSEFDSKHQDPEPCVAGNRQASPSCHRLSGQAICTVIGTHDSKRGHHLQIQTVGDPAAGARSSHVDVKPKREEKFIPLCPKEQEISKAEATAGPQVGCSPGAGKREQHKLTEHNKEAKLSGSQGLTAGLESESRRSPVPGRGLRVAKGSDVTKEAKLDKTMAPAQHRFNLSGNKNESRPATEAKVQLKQSKRVRDVVWDEQGMTWEVYGASLDPESLGIAIQNHLQRQIREHEKLIKSQNTQNRKSISSDTSSNKKLKGRQHNVFQSMLQNFRRPNCCVRPTASSVLD
ncbi:G protein-regulated inducer of neurite outgrowth 3 [Eublepharis macularius]|uniref:G protein-regulated inducer of neurite outgrowth 3 n=1 Tax=Eublepharis macularius TaxID=481883 RepID=A0AA97LBF4_EUBMA|nr:G protein-regulated inducer of neurite outgrowth 3 [Eublepharis macularius]